jgi:hypothetical protein
MKGSTSTSRSWIVACLSLGLSTAALVIALAAPKAPTLPRLDLHPNGILSAEELRIAKSVAAGVALRQMGDWDRDLYLAAGGEDRHWEAVKQSVDHLVSLGADAGPGVHILLSDTLLPSWSTSHENAMRVIERLDPSIPWVKMACYSALDSDRWDTVERAALWLVQNSPEDVVSTAVMMARHRDTYGLALFIFGQLHLNGHIATGAGSWARARYGALEWILNDAQAEPALRADAAVLAALCEYQYAIPDLLDLLDDERDTKIDFFPKEGWKDFAHLQPEASDDDLVTVRVNDAAVWALQKLTGEDFGFTTCHESRKDMPQIVERARKCVKEIIAEREAQRAEEQKKLDALREHLRKRLKRDGQLRAAPE